ncbi:MAG: lysine--tRNA ligase [Candidatus Hodarchaeales archaeon]
MTSNLKDNPQHWVDQLTTDLIQNWPNIKDFNCNCGISVSGKQHVGRLRGEIVLTNAVTTELQARGLNATHYLILYTSDPWKGKEAQLNAFKEPEDAKKYINQRLIDVPDPTGKASSWVEYYWEEFGKPLPKFARDVKIIRTHELYQNKDMKKTIVDLIKNKDIIRNILNKYRKENPFPEDWIPLNPLCTKCNKIGTTKALEVDLDKYLVKYYCSNCKEEGWSDMSLGKLTWRLEWLAIWYVLNVHFEPYGKDHATPGGSRDSCIEVLETVLKRKGPFGFWNEWVGYSEGRVDFGDMTSSGFIGFTPTVWLTYAEPEVLKYIYLKTPPRRRIVLGLDKLPSYIAEYDRAQRIYFGIEPFDDKSELHSIKRSYEIVFYNKVPPYRGFQLDFSHAIILSQLVPGDETGLEIAIKKLMSTEILTQEPTQEIRDHIETRLSHARNWVRSEYAPSHLRFNIQETVPDSLVEKIDTTNLNLIRSLSKEFKSIKWNEPEIKDAMIKIRNEANLSKKGMIRFFKTLYEIFLGQPKGPRFAPFIAALDKQWVIERMESIEKRASK